MTIETKYNIGDEVWVCDTDKHIYVGTISKVRIYLLEDGIYIDCLVDFNAPIVWNCWISEKAVFPTKEELLKNL
jgi:hypothetical protein